MYSYTKNTHLCSQFSQLIQSIHQWHSFIFIHLNWLSVKVQRAKIKDAIKMLYLKHLFLVHVISSVTVTHKKCVYGDDGGSDRGGYLSILNKPFILRAEPPLSTNKPIPARLVYMSI